MINVYVEECHEPYQKEPTGLLEVDDTTSVIIDSPSEKNDVSRIGFKRYAS